MARKEAADGRPRSLTGSLLMIELLSGVYWFDDALQTALKRHGWTTTTRSQSMLFANLAAGEYRQARIAKNLGVTRQAISQMLAELEKRGLVTLEVDPSDRRARVVRLQSTPLGQAARVVLTKLEAVLEQRVGPALYNAMREGLQADWGALPAVDPNIKSSRQQPARPKRRPASRP